MTSGSPSNNEMLLKNLTALFNSRNQLTKLPNDTDLVALAKAISTVDGYALLGKIFNELVKYPDVVEKILANPEALYWLSLKKGTTESSSQVKITVSRDDRINTLLGYCANISAETWNDMTAKLNKAENVRFKLIVRKSFDNYDDVLSKKINWELTELPAPNAVVQEETHSINKDDLFPQAINAFLALTQDADFSTCENIGDSFFYILNGKTGHSNTKFDNRCSTFFTQFREVSAHNPAIFYNIIAVLMAYDGAETELIGGLNPLKTRGSLWTILSGAGDNIFTPAERIKLIKHLFLYIQHLFEHDTESEILRKANKLLDEQVALFKTQDASEKDKRAFLALLESNSVPAGLKNKATGLASDFAISNGEAGETVRTEAFNVGKACFFALSLDDAQQTIITNCENIVTQLNTSISGTGVADYNSRITEFYDAFFGENTNDNLKRLVAVLINANHAGTLLTYGDWLGTTHRTNLWTIFIGNTSFETAHRIKLIQFAFDYLHVLSGKNSLTDDHLKNAMEFIGDQIAAFLKHDGNIHDILPSIFKEENFEILRQNSTNSSINSILKNCFCVVLHDSLHQAGRESDWLLVTKAAGFSNWGESDIQSDNTAWTSLNEMQQAEKNVLCTAAATDKAETDINKQYKDYTFNNYTPFSTFCTN